MAIKILIIDDEPDFVEMTKMRLESADYEVTTAFDGSSGLYAAQRDSPDLILLDVMMPGVDGFEVLRELRKNSATRSVPVVMLTAKGETKWIFKAQALGATDYLIKPCESEDLLGVIGKHT